MDELRKLQIYEMDILLKFRDICNKHNLNYFLIGGTLLGAVRHKGFIPWDDDIDVGMPRKDYEKFLEIGQKELGDRYFLHNWYTDRNYCWPHSMIRIVGTSVLHKNSKYDNKLSSCGIGIDVFVFDNMSDDVVNVKRQHRKAMIIKWLLFGKADCFLFCELDMKKKITYALFLFISKLLKKDYIIKIFNDNAQKYNSKDSSAIIDVGGLQGLNDWIEYEENDVMPKLEYEGYKFNVPYNYDEVLRRVYGEYMELPPVEKRNFRHDIQEYNFGQYVPDVYRKENLY